MFEKVLVAVDGSPHARTAIPAAVDIARKSGGEIVVLHVREHSVIRGQDWDMESGQEAQAIVDEACREIETSGVKARTAVVRSVAGYVPRAILEAADENGADLIVLGSRGRSDLQGLLLGSVTHKVIQLSHRPVLVTR